MNKRPAADRYNPRTTPPSNNSPISPKNRFTWPNIVRFLASGLGSGYVRFFPGTWGTLAAGLPLWLFWGTSIETQLVIILIALAAGTSLCNLASRYYKKHDDQRIVIDEWVGLWISACAINPNWITWITCIMVFRFFDILKPQPIGNIDRNLKSGFGIMLDDVIAGIYANFTVRAIFWLLEKGIVFFV